MATAVEPERMPSAARWDWRLWGLVAIALVAYAPLLFRFFAWQWLRPEYQAFPLVLGAVAFFLFDRWNDAPPVDKPVAGSRWVAMVLAGVAWLLLAAAIVLYSPWLATTSMIVLVAAVVVLLRRERQVSGAWGAWALLWLILPLPLNLDRQLIAWLQLKSSWISSQILDALGVLHVMRGNVLQLPDRELFVDEACSGIVSLISIVTCIALWGVWQRRGGVHLLVLVVFGVIWVALMNAVRITTIAAAWQWWQLDLSEGMPHTALGLVLFAISAGVVYCLDGWTLELLAPVHADWREHDESSEHPGLRLMQWWDRLIASRTDDEEQLEDAWENPVVEAKSGGVAPGALPIRSARKSPWPGLIFATAWIGLIALQGINWKGPQKALGPIMSTPQRALALNGSFNPAPQMEEFVQAGFSVQKRETGSLWGEHSSIWTFRDGEGREYTLSLDFPFGPDWHDLAVCYRGTGWGIDRRQVDDPFRSVDSSDPGWKMSQMWMRRVEDDECGFVSFVGFGLDGVPVDTPDQTFWGEVFARVRRIGNSEGIGAYYQLQVVCFAEGDQVSADQVELANRLLHTARYRLMEHLRE